MAIDDPASVAAFDAAADEQLLPIYRLNATMLNRLLPEDGVLVDFGCGSGRLLAHLAEARNDVRLIGIDISQTMVDVGRSMLAARSLDDRVEIRVGDMTEASRIVDPPPRIDLVSTIWSLHHLPGRDDVMRLLRQVSSLRDRFGCGVWIFDLARLRHDETMPAVLDVAEDAPATLRADAIASERAAWTEDELRMMFAESGLDGLRGGRDRTTGHLQAWWINGRTYEPRRHASLWTASALPPTTEFVERRLEHDLPDLPATTPEDVHT